MDNTPPRNRLIAFYSALAVATLLALKPAFDSYFDHMHARVQAEGINRGFVETAVLGEPAAEVARAARRGLLSRADGFQRCYEERFEAKQGLVGSVQATVQAPNGVVEVQLGQSELEDPPLTDCTRRVLQSIEASAFASGPVRVAVSYAPTEAELRKLTWRDELQSGPTPIGDAMARLGHQGRLAFPQIRPTTSGEMNLDPLRGWAQLPRELPPEVARHAAPQSATGAEGASAADATKEEQAGAGEAVAPEGAAPQGAAEQGAAAQPAGAQPSGAQPSGAQPAAQRRAAPPANAPQAPTNPQPAQGAGGTAE